MKHSLIIAALSVLPLTLSAQTTQLPAQTSIRDFAADTISVTGTGRINIAPDKVTFTAGVETSAPTVEDAVNQNTTQTNALIAALKKAGASDKEIRTSNFSVFPQYEYIENRRPRVTGFNAVNTVTVTRKNATDASKLLTAAVSAGANQISGLTFGVHDQQKARDRGLQLAFEDAKAKAALLASAAGRGVGRAISIVEGSAPQDVPRPMYGKTAALEARVANVPVETGEDELSFSVSVVFELR